MSSVPLPHTHPQPKPPSHVNQFPTSHPSPPKKKGYYRFIDGIRWYSHQKMKSKDNMHPLWDLSTFYFAIFPYIRRRILICVDEIAKQTAEITSQLHALSTS
jgi:hypothetical protein